ncbi:MAG: protein kinase [Acidobacteriota bacterium]|nr:PD40 domain-containing protein [Acidobacteriota bacterium]MDQ3418644.1 protein kinase [Acidobacteriota bacterium]
MALTSGTRLGSYEIGGPIGAGGMGEVYRARDMKLHRDVAVKLLPDIFAADPDRVLRFQREAQTLASLNHSNIAQIYGVIDQPPALVMELVDGPDLSERLRAGPIPVDEALPIARQVAEALEAAHDQGIVHRDLKPANIKVRDDGSVKVLDFGLAKALDTTSGDGTGRHAPGIELSPTFTSPALTEMGVILGTAAYMAPEQAKGKTVDKRADIWAFGVVLYEMLAGRSLFACETSSETVAAVIRADIDLSALPRETPPSVRRLIARCLERDPRVRLRDIGEARILLATVPSGERAPATPARASRSRVAAWAIAGALAGGLLVWLLMAAGAAGPVGAPTDFVLRRLTELPGAETHPDLSPDGRQVLYASAASGNLDLFLLRVGGARAINLTPDSPADDNQGTISPDGERIAFRSERDKGGIFVMGATGESVRRVTTAGFDPAWSADGLSLAYATEGVIDPYSRNANSQLWTIELSTGKTSKLTEGDAVQPAWSPDGTRIAYWANNGGQRDIWTIDVRGGQPVAVTQDAATDWSPEWSPDGRWLYYSSDRSGSTNIWRVAVDQRTGAPGGAPQPITSSLTGVAYARFAADGHRLSVMAFSRSYELSLATIDSGAEVRVRPAAVVRSPSLGWCSPAPKAEWLACTGRSGNEDIFLMRPDGSETIRLTDDPAKDRNPTWSPDGDRIAFMSTRSGEWELWSMRRDGSDVRQMTDVRSDIFEAVWAPDGRRAATAVATRPPFGTLVFDLASPATRESATFLKNALPETFSAESWSPDDKLIAGSMVDGAGVPRTAAVLDVATGHTRAFDVPGPRYQFGSAVAGWLPDSRRVLVASDTALAVVDTTTGAWTTVAVPLAGGTRYRLTYNARSLLMERAVLDADIWLLEIK